MKRSIRFLATGVGLVLLGCNKKYVCEHGYYCLPVNISFLGFLPEDLDTLVLKTYTQENEVLRLIATDTSYPMPVWLSDTAYQHIAPLSVISGAQLPEPIPISTRPAQIITLSA